MMMARTITRDSPKSITRLVLETGPIVSVFVNGDPQMNFGVPGPFGGGGSRGGTR